MHVIEYMYLDLRGCYSKELWGNFLYHGKNCVNLHFVCCRSQIAYTAIVDPEAQEKIQKRAERFKSSLMPQRPAATSILNSIHSLVRITSFWMFAISWLYFYLTFTFTFTLPSVLCRATSSDFLLFSFLFYYLFCSHLVKIGKKWTGVNTMWLEPVKT